MKIFQIGDEVWNIAVVRGNNDNRTTHRMPEARDEKRTGTAGKSGNEDVVFSAKGIGGNAPKIRDVGNTRQQLRNSLFENVHFGLAGHQDFLESNPSNTRSITPV